MDLTIHVAFWHLVHSESFATFMTLQVKKRCLKSSWIFLMNKVKVKLIVLTLLTLVPRIVILVSSFNSFVLFKVLP
jgi:flagellar biosynthesis protein FliP